MDQSNPQGRESGPEQAELKRRATRDRLIIETAVEGIWTVDPQNRIDYVNPRAEEMLGYSPAELLKKAPSRELLFPEDPAGDWLGLDQCTRGVATERDMRLRRKDGSAIWVHFTCKPILGKEAGYSGAILAFQDISERKRAAETIRRPKVDLEELVKERTERLQASNRSIKMANEALRISNEALLTANQSLQAANRSLGESEARFRLMADSSPFMIWVTNSRGSIEFVNKAFREFFGINLAEVKPTSGWETFLHPDDAQAYLDAYASALRERQSFFAEARVRRADGEWRWIASTANPRLGESGRFLGLVGSSPDITERKQTEESLRQALARIEALNRDLDRHATELVLANKELESFAYSVSHDLRTPLATIEGLSRVLQEDYGVSLPQAAQRYLDLIRSGTQQMDTLIQSLLGLSRLSRQALNKQPVNMTALVKEALAALEKEANRSDLTIEVQELPDAVADPILLKQVWVNLIANAVKFTRGCGNARIQVGSEQRSVGSEQRPVGSGQSTVSSEPNSLSTGKTPLSTVYYVRDNGVGFDMEQVGRLFGVFQRLHSEEEYEGTGVGLAIVQRIIHRHGGRVWAEGRAGDGATFYFTLG